MQDSRTILLYYTVHHPFLKNLLINVINTAKEEVGELARVMARTYGDQSFKAGERANLADEMADVLWVLVCLANQTGVDLTEAIEANFAKKTSRDKERHLNNSKLNKE